MANKFDQYGLKEVANVTFYSLDTGMPVLFLDTLKVSNIETSAENVSAQGGWGNPKLITWEYGKEVNLTLEDALFSPESLKVMMGANLVEAKGETKVRTQLNEDVVLAEDGTATLKIAPVDGQAYALIDGAYVAAASVTDKVVTFTGKTGKVKVFYTADLTETEDGFAIEISANKFGGDYKIVGDTLVKGLNGTEEAFQFIIGKAKVNSNVSFNMSADGDPATFSMDITAQKDEDGNMFKLVKYNLGK
jgi:hypothetical protein